MNSTTLTGDLSALILSDLKFGALDYAGKLQDIKTKLYDQLLFAKYDYRLHLVFGESWNF